MSGYTKVPESSMPNGFDPERFYNNTVKESLLGLGGNKNQKERSKDLNREIKNSKIRQVPK